ncbi:uncharacterized protein LOC126825748 [Patella vulgata]|uniref:uncharacterized protein LOC126825748 n=1 Tax=Patella vulgata TaxID=6465 RepID=UPI00217F38C9|nr:uncharacterized protein LOC126825748 [Patella vulgata]
MSDRLTTWIVAVMLIIFNTLQILDAVNCIQCNIKVKGANNNCDNPRNVTDCEACLKTYTKIVNHESWLNERSSEYYSKLCIRKTATSKIRDAGCYKQTNNGGYTEQCYCYTNGCNSADNQVLHKGVLAIVLTGVPLLKYFLG